MTTPPLDERELAGVTGALERAGEEVVGGLRSALISGGRSNLTILLSDDSSRWVLRTPPRHGRTPSAHDVTREFRVTRALRSSGVPVARAVCHATDEALLGGPFAVWEFVEGTTVQTRAALEALTSVTPIADRLVEALAALHDVDYRLLDLERFGRPDAYFERQVSRWSRQWDHVAPDPVLSALAAEVVSRLAGEVPVQKESAVVHGDFRIDNALLRLEGEPRVAAIVDWELSTIGDPVADMATMCAYRHPAFDDVLGFETAWASDRLPSADALVERYEAARGREVHAWAAYLALAYYKIAVISAGIDFRWKAEGRPENGNTTSGKAVAPFLEAALELLRH